MRRRSSFLLNTARGGTLYIGVDDDRKPVGVDDIDAVELQIKDRIKNNIPPPIKTKSTKKWLYIWVKNQFIWVKNHEQILGWRPHRAPEYSGVTPGSAPKPHDDELIRPIGP